MTTQITIDGKTWCKREFGWIGPDLKAPGFWLRRKLNRMAK